MKKKDALKFYGTQVEVARMLNITKQAVCNWPDIVPIRQAFRINKLSAGLVDLSIEDYK